MEQPPFLVAICGWADTGKSTLAAELSHALASQGISADWISTDVFLKNREQRNSLGISGYNPLSFHANEFSAAVDQLAAQREYVYYPYDNRAGANALTPRTILPVSTIVIEGIHAFHDAVRDLCRLRVFIDSDEGTLRTLRARANVNKRGMNPAEASKRIDSEFEDYTRYLAPKKRFADVCLNVGLDFEYHVRSGAV
jgi:uridine kinase